MYLRVHFSGTAHHWIQIQDKLWEPEVLKFTHTEHALRAQCSSESTYSVHCTCNEHRLVHVQCTLHAHGVPMIARTVYTACSICTCECTASVQCTCSVLSEPLVCQCNAFLHRFYTPRMNIALLVHLVHALSAPCMHYVCQKGFLRHECAGNLPNVSRTMQLFRISNVVVAHCCTDKLPK